MRAVRFTTYVILFLAIPRAMSGQPDTLARLPKHYFSTMIVLDAYRKPDKDLNDPTRIGSRLQTYGIKQLMVSLYTPLYTRTESRGSGVTPSEHVLFTFNLFSLRPQFAGLSAQHNLVKAGAGVRYIYNTGRKGVWFVDVSPFVTRDVTYPSRPYYRLASTIIYSHNSSDKLNWRVGITKSFLWGNRLYLPFIGLRIGRLDAVHFSVQLPRSLQLNVPLGHRVIVSLYSRPQGGMFNFSNHDTLYFRSSEATFHFARYELNTGFRVDARVNPRFAFYAAAGLSTRNQITFYSQAAARRAQSGPYFSYFYTRKPAPTLFVSLGVVLKFGKTRSYYYEKNLYDAMDLNRVNGADDGNMAVPIPPRKLKDVNLESVRDLLDYTEY